jgi:hypothetical protein
MKDEGGRLTTNNVSRALLQPENRQVRVVYKRSNSAGKPPVLATFGDPRRAFQVGIQGKASPNPFGTSNSRRNHWTYVENCQCTYLFGESLQSRLSMSLQQQEIGPEACPPRRPRKPVAGMPENAISNSAYASRSWPEIPFPDHPAARESDDGLSGWWAWLRFADPLYGRANACFWDDPNEAKLEWR